MRKKKTCKYSLITKFSDEATRLMTPTPEWQRRMFRIAATSGRDIERVGLLAGRTHTENSDKVDH
jgi:hypothetical protein